MVCMFNATVSFVCLSSHSKTKRTSLASINPEKTHLEVEVDLKLIYSLLFTRVKELSIAVDMERQGHGMNPVIDVSKGLFFILNETAFNKLRKSVMCHYNDLLPVEAS